MGSWLAAQPTGNAHGDLSEFKGKIAAISFLSVSPVEKINGLVFQGKPLY